MTEQDSRLYAEEQRLRDALLGRPPRVTARIHRLADMHPGRHPNDLNLTRKESDDAREL